MQGLKIITKRNQSHISIIEAPLNIYKGLDGDSHLDNGEFHIMEVRSINPL